MCGAERPMEVLCLEYPEPTGSQSRSPVALGTLMSTNDVEETVEGRSVGGVEGDIGNCCRPFVRPSVCLSFNRII